MEFGGDCAAGLRFESRDAVPAVAGASSLAAPSDSGAVGSSSGVEASGGSEAASPVSIHWVIPGFITGVCVCVCVCVYLCEWLYLVK